MATESNDGSTGGAGQAAGQATGQAAGQPKDAGWDVGVRTTVPVALPVVWNYLLNDGAKLWLGDLASVPQEKGAPYETADGVHGVIRTCTDGVGLRLTWRPDDWPHDTTLHVTVKPVPEGTTIGIRHEQLSDREERRMMLGHWKNVIDDLGRALRARRA